MGKYRVFTVLCSKRHQAKFGLIAVFLVWVVCANPAIAFAVEPTAKSCAALDTRAVLIDDLSDPINVYPISVDFYVLKNTFPIIGAACIVKFHAFARSKTDRLAVSAKIVSWYSFSGREFKVEVPESNYGVRCPYVRQPEMYVQRAIHCNWDVQYASQNNLWTVGRNEGSESIFRLSDLASPSDNPQTYGRASKHEGKKCNRIVEGSIDYCYEPLPEGFAPALLGFGVIVGGLTFSISWWLDRLRRRQRKRLSVMRDWRQR